MRTTRTIGLSRKVHVKDLKPGMVLQEPILGFRGKTLIHSGEVLSAKHVEQIQKWIGRPGVGCLLQYTKTVYAQATDASGDERPACDANPYEAHSVQRLWKKSMGSGKPPTGANLPSSVRKKFRMVNGELVEVPA